jgi:radical SAM protein with 4Fe4S-binding SPASM domain
MELTVHCNLKCTYCYSESGPTKKSALSLEQIVQVLTQARDLGLIWIDFTGGEFFMYRHWHEALKIARALGLIVTLHTNGTTLNERNLAAVQEAGVRCLQVSLDSHIPEVHDRMRGVPGALEKTLNGVRMAKEMKLPVRVVIMVHEGNKDYIEDTLRFFREDLVVPIMIDRIISAGGELDAKVGLATKEYYELIAPLLTRNVVSTRICENKGAPKHENVEPHCGVAQSFIYMTADGEFALCPTMTSRDRPFFTGPSIHDMDIKTAWLDSDYFNQYRFTNCRNIGVCPAAKQCGGGCRSNAYFETGEIDSPDVFNCNMSKNPTPQFVDFLQRYEQGVFGVV